MNFLENIKLTDLKSEGGGDVVESFSICTVYNFIDESMDVCTNESERTFVDDTVSYEEIERGRRSSASRQLIRFRRRFKLSSKISSQ